MIEVRNTMNHEIVYISHKNITLQQNIMKKKINNNICYTCNVKEI